MEVSGAVDSDSAKKPKHYWAAPPRMSRALRSASHQSLPCGEYGNTRVTNLVYLHLVLGAGGKTVVSQVTNEIDTSKASVMQKRPSDKTAQQMHST